MDSLSTDVTLVTIGGAKTTCRAGNGSVRQDDGSDRMFGRFSWALATALLKTAPGSDWLDILSAMRVAVQSQGWSQPVLFRGQVTDAFQAP